MASNTQLDSGTGGDILTTKERSHDGDSTKTQSVTLAGVSGTEGSYTYADIDAGDGVAAKALRVTLANDTLQGNVISTNNSKTDSSLAPGAKLTGSSDDVSKYGRAGIAIFCSNSSGTIDGSIHIEVSHNGTDWGGPTRTWANIRFGQPHMWNIVEKYFRVTYTNGSQTATDISMQVQYSNNTDIFLGHQLDETLLNETEAIITRSVSVGQDPNLTYINEPVSGVDNDNSSTTNLTSGTSRTFTGSWHDIGAFHGITVLVDGTTSGSAVSGTLKMQFSHDGSTLHRDIVVTTDDVRDTLPRTLGVVAKYFQVIYISDGDLTSFDIQTMFHTEQVQLVSRLDGTIQGNEDVATVRAVLVGETGSGSFVNVKASNGGAIASNLADLDGNTIAVGAGNNTTGVQRVSIATDDINLAAINANQNPGTATSAATAFDQYTHLAINLTIGANQVLVASSANKQIWVYGIAFSCSADGTSVSFQDELDVPVSGIMTFAQYGGMASAPTGNFEMPLWKLGTDKDLEVDILTGDVDGYLTYAIVSV